MNYSDEILLTKLNKYPQYVKELTKKLLELNSNNENMSKTDFNNYILQIIKSLSEKYNRTK